MDPVLPQLLVCRQIGHNIEARSLESLAASPDEEVSETQEDDSS